MQTYTMQTPNQKHTLGQFYTTNYARILQNIAIPAGVTTIVEPFAGNGDLLQFLGADRANYVLECFDIDPRQNWIVARDTILDPPDFTGKFVLTNPPFLARNKCANKTAFDLYGTNDLYKCFIKILLASQCTGGIIIVPLNFISSIRKSDVELREQFTKTFDILQINIFEEPVFDDTTYAICSFQFTRKFGDNQHTTNCNVYPGTKTLQFVLCDTNNYSIGGEIYNLPQSTNYKIERATRLHTSTMNLTNILVKCIDDSMESTLGMSFVSDDTARGYIDITPNLSARSYAVLVITPALSGEQQYVLIEAFNDFVNEKRDAYNSLFLTNFRESNTIARKRISFGLVYSICNYLLR